jgi:hypothetical protein
LMAQRLNVYEARHEASECGRIIRPP